MLNYFTSIDHRMHPGDCQCGTGRTYLVKYMMYVPVPQKLIFFQKIPLKKSLFVNVGVAESIFTGQIYFQWPHLFSLVEPILTRQLN